MLGRLVTEMTSIHKDRLTCAAVRISIPSSVGTAFHAPSGEREHLSFIVSTSEANHLCFSAAAINVVCVCPLSIYHTCSYPSSLREVICLPSGDQLTATIGLRCSR